MEQQKEDALANMSTVHRAQNMTERRRKQLEHDLDHIQRDLNKQSNEKLELEKQLEKVRGSF